MKRVLNFLFAFGLAFIMTGISAEEKPPLAPPSHISLSFEEMILHFRVFILSDMFQRISRPSSGEEKFFRLTDVELDFLFKKSVEKEPLLQDLKKFRYCFVNRELCLNLEDQYFRCYRLEVFPEEYEFKIEKLEPGIFEKNYTAKDKGK